MQLLLEGLVPAAVLRLMLSAVEATLTAEVLQPVVLISHYTFACATSYNCEVHEKQSTLTFSMWPPSL
jgi:hypothetical protein